MRPLQSIAIGLVIIALRAEFGGYDALADPVGWLLVLLGVRSLPVEPDAADVAVRGGRRGRQS